MSGHRGFPFLWIFALAAAAPLVIGLYFLNIDYDLEGDRKRAQQARAVRAQPSNTSPAIDRGEASTSLQPVPFNTERASAKNKNVAGPSIGGLSTTVPWYGRREGRRVAVLTDQFFYCYPPASEVYAIPKSFETDYASVPAWAARFVYNLRADDEAAVVHDWLYAVGRPGQREKADLILRYAMYEQGVPAFTRNLMFLAVRLRGETAYGKPEEWRFIDPVTHKPSTPPFTQAEAPLPIHLPCNCLDAYVARLRASGGASLGYSAPLDGGSVSAWMSGGGSKLDECLFSDTGAVSPSIEIPAPKDQKNPGSTGQ